MDLPEEEGDDVPRDTAAIACFSGVRFIRSHETRESRGGGFGGNVLLDP